MSAERTLARLPEPLSDEQHRALDEILRGPRRSIDGPFIPLVRSPALLTHLQRAGTHLRFDAELVPEVLELVILVIARRWNQQFEWAVHSALALKAGVPAAAVEALAVGREPEDLTDGQQRLYELLTELLASTQVSDTTYAAAVSVLGEVALVEAIAAAGYYTTPGHGHERGGHRGIGRAGATGRAQKVTDPDSSLEEQHQTSAHAAALKPPMRVRCPFRGIRARYPERKNTVLCLPPDLLMLRAFAGVAVHADGVHRDVSPCLSAPAANDSELAAIPDGRHHELVKQRSVGQRVNAGWPSLADTPGHVRPTAHHVIGAETADERLVCLGRIRDHLNPLCLSHRDKVAAVGAGGTGDGQRGMRRQREPVECRSRRERVHRQRRALRETGTGRKPGHPIRGHHNLLGVSAALRPVRDDNRHDLVAKVPPRHAISECVDDAGGIHAGNVRRRKSRQTL
jgi:4-carboxymuconolactone decarboxylase